MTSYAPIVVFAYKRPQHLLHTLQSLRRCDGFARSRTIIFCDGPKTPAELGDVNATRRIAQEQLGADAEYHFRESNAGLATSIIGGVSEVTRRFGCAIVVEDDLEFSRNFLTYVNAGLDRYKDEARVFQISAQLFETPGFDVRTSAMFLPFTTSWGWGTWRRAWDRFDPAADGWEALRTDRALRRRFNLGGSYDYATMLERQMAKLGDSWAIRWYWSVFRNDGVVCFPPTSLVRNTGLDGSGTHGRGKLRRFASHAGLREAGQIDFPSQAVVRPEDLDLIKKAIWIRNGGRVGSTVDFIRRRLFLLTGKHM